MSLRKRRNLLLLAVFHFIMLAAFLPGCKEGESNSPASDLFFKFDPRQIDNTKANYNLKGFVFDLINSNSPVKQASITVDASSTYFTDDSGHFYVAEKQIGSHSIKIVKNGYYSANYSFSVDSSGKAIPDDLLLPLIPEKGVNGSITGQVAYNTARNPASISVFLFSYPAVPGDLEFIASTSIAANGFFNFYVPASKYAVYVGETSNPPTVVGSSFFTGNDFIGQTYDIVTALNSTKYVEIKE